jgi:hypothetical protein
MVEYSPPRDIWFVNRDASREQDVEQFDVAACLVSTEFSSPGIPKDQQCRIRVAERFLLPRKIWSVAPGRQQLLPSNVSGQYVEGAFCLTSKTLLRSPERHMRPNSSRFWSTSQLTLSAVVGLSSSQSWEVIKTPYPTSLEGLRHPHRR